VAAEGEVVGVEEEGAEVEDSVEVVVDLGEVVVVDLEEEHQEAEAEEEVVEVFGDHGDKLSDFI
jgi:hypothetical protein